ncbi:hypothetical protein BCR34DRAFT_53000 [Clohesyomyces aquaticus]|uniref:Uncharacterized protein n=1 Tax=Clohesyomyces aquaticus TaxID=1231657 RepID=A0A1Y2A4A8_9PLEO|nr:hypothetical protein BCR34DRAFT_53000 [Clohesyomyces aquaticus]
MCPMPLLRLSQWLVRVEPQIFLGNNRRISALHVENSGRLGKVYADGSPWMHAIGCECDDREKANAAFDHPPRDLHSVDHRREDNDSIGREELRLEICTARTSGWRTLPAQNRKAHVEVSKAGSVSAPNFGRCQNPKEIRQVPAPFMKIE